MSTQKNSTPTQEELQREAVEILQMFNDSFEEFDTGKVKDTLLNVFHDVYPMKDNSVFNDDDAFVLYKLHRIAQRIEKWQANAAIWSVTRETLS